MNRFILRLEGLVVFLISLYFYSHYNFGWGIFVLLLLSPDLSMLGYLKDKHIGTIVYNIFHTYIVTLFMIFIGIIGNIEFFIMLGLIWTAHIGMDRILGYGLKYSTGFKDTHLQRL